MNNLNVELGLGSIAVAPKRVQRGQTPTRNQLLSIAAKNPDICTKKGAGELLAANGFSKSPKHVDELLALPSFIRRERLNRASRVTISRLGYLPKITNPQPSNHPTPTHLHLETPELRLNQVRIEAVKSTAQNTFRSGAAGGGSMQVEFSNDPEQVGYVVNMSSNRDTYGGSFKGWSASEDHHRITVPKDWRIRVEGRELAELSGLMTLDAHPLMPHGEIKLYSAKWARQGRGFGVIVDNGFIAILDGEHFHADTFEDSIKGVTRKLKSARNPNPTATSPYLLSLEDFIQRYQKYDIDVKVKDASDSGSCDYGIRSWCASVGLDYDAGKAPLSAVLEGFRVLPQEEVRRAVVHAIRRSRNTR